MDAEPYVEPGGDEAVGGAPAVETDADEPGERTGRDGMQTEGRTTKKQTNNCHRLRER